MKKFKITSPEGKTLVLTSQDDIPPSEQELEQIFSSSKQDIPIQPEESMQERSAKYGSITKTPTLLEKISSRINSPKTRPLGLTGGLGVGMSMAGIPEEDILPAVGQGVGGMTTGFTGAGMLGATGGAVAGQGARQLIKQIRGEKPDIGALGKEALTTGAIEGVTRGFGNVFFRKQVANEALNKLSNKLIEMKQSLASNPNLKAKTFELYSHMTDAFDSLPEPMKTGKVAQRLKTWMKYMSDKSGLTAKDLILMEEDLGKAANFGEVSKGVFMPASDIPNAATNRIAKTSRTKVSDLVDQLSEQGGQKEFKSTSQKLSKAISKSKDYDPTKGYGSWSGRMGSAIGATAITGNPLAGVGAYALEKTLQNPTLRNTLFKIIRNKAVSGVGTGTKLTMSELARRASK